MKNLLLISVYLLFILIPFYPMFIDAGPVSVTVSATVPSSGGGGGGGGGGGSSSSDVTSVTFSGRAYPLSKVFILKDGQIAASSIAGPNAVFQISLSNLSEGNYVFSVYGEDDQGRKSTLFTFPVFVTDGVNTKVSDIFITPTIDVDKSQVKKGDNIAIFGRTAPNSDVVISVNSPIEYFRNTTSDGSGGYLLNFDSSPLDMGSHHTKSKAELAGQISQYGKVLGFMVGNENILNNGDNFLRGDLNDDGKVNLVDFSIAAFWYKKTLTGDIINKEVERLNGDSKIDLIDFSIMAYNWTG